MNKNSPARLPGEDFKTYKQRRKAFGDNVKLAEKGELVYDSGKREAVTNVHGKQVLPARKGVPHRSYHYD